MAQWVVETTDVATGKSNESDWREIASVSKKDDALRKAKDARKRAHSPKTRVRVRIDYGRGGMAG